MAYGRRKTTRRKSSTRSYQRDSSSRGSNRRAAPRRKSTVSKRAASSPRPQRVIIEVRQAPPEANPIEGLLASATPAKKPRKARF